VRRQLGAVFCADEETPIQALDRLDLVVPLSLGRGECHSFEYFRHGTVSLSAALYNGHRTVHGKTAARHKPQPSRVPGEQSAGSLPLHVHIFVLAEPSRTLVRQDRTDVIASLNLHFRL